MLHYSYDLLSVRRIQKVNLAAMIDHTLLKADATAAQIEKLCREARQYSLASVCINPVYVSFAAGLLTGSPVKVCTVIGFPLGAVCSEDKAEEAHRAIANGAAELDMVLAIGAAKSGDWQSVESDLRAVCRAAGKEALVKVILETCLLTDEEIVTACLSAQRAGAAFVKTSTGFSSGGATEYHVELMRKTVGRTMGVKASGGIRSAAAALAMIKAGANRIGTSSGPAIILEYETH
ncbi:MAG: deoxyribose-phosphate aldolase [Negativicutes bacterium]|nr:deoxyribose-phosphate aldolase [Negativicutes bacterium]